MTLTDEEVFELIKDNLQLKPWVVDSRKYHKKLKALVLGEDFHEELIERIEKIESSDRAIARERYSKDIRDVFGRVMQPRHSIFTASGGSVEYTMTSDAKKEKLIQTLKTFKGQKSLTKYLSENFFVLADTDPNGILFVEYYKDEKIYPTYKSINDIRCYYSNGQLCEFIIFEPVETEYNGLKYNKWRVVDDKTERCVYQRGEEFIISDEPSETFEHPFGKVPAVILSDNQRMGCECRISSLYDIEELASDYARDKSILTIYKFQHGFPRHWRYVKLCRKCNGTGKDGDGHTCKACGGTGEMRRNDVTDVTTLDMPREDDQLVTPNLEGFVAPDLATWQRYKEDLRDSEEMIESTMWGTKRITNANNETATGRFIDVQPVINKLGVYTSNVEWVHNRLANWVNNWINNQPNQEPQYYKAYGRRFIIESPDSILDKYTQAREKGDNSTILDKLLDEYILSKYQTDPVMLERMQKKRKVEPYIHMDVKTVNEIFGGAEAAKIPLFVEFWEQADKNKKAEDLQKDFDSYIAGENERKALTEIELTRKLLSQQSPLLASKMLESMSQKQVLSLIGLEAEEK